MIFILQKDLKMRKLCAKWLPRALGEVQKMNSIQDMPYQSGWFQHEGIKMLYQIFATWNLITSIWTRTKEAIKWMASSYFSTSFDRICLHRKSWSLPCYNQNILECHPVHEDHTLNVVYYRSFVVYHLHRILQGKMSNTSKQCSNPLHCSLCAKLLQ